MATTHTDQINYHERARALNELLTAAGNVTAWADVRDNRAAIDWEWDELKDPCGPYWHDFAVGLAFLLLGPQALQSDDPTDPVAAERCVRG